MKAKISLGLSKLSIPVKIEKARHIVTAMTDNANFTSPFPTLENVSAAIDALETAHNAAQGGGKTQTSIMREKESLLDNALSQLANYVESTANGIESVVLSSGMGLKAKGGRQASTFTVDDGAHAGELVLRTKSELRSSYVWQMISDSLPNATPASAVTQVWQQLGVSIKASFIANNLIAGTRYWFRVATVNASGQSAWSDPISKIVSI
jgi:hypothetical protein